MASTLLQDWFLGTLDTTLLTIMACQIAILTFHAILSRSFPLGELSLSVGVLIVAHWLDVALTFMSQNAITGDPIRNAVIAVLLLRTLLVVVMPVAGATRIRVIADAATRMATPFTNAED